MDHSSLASAIAHWLEYERLCGRETLLSEAALKAPLGEFLLSTQGHALEAEVPYPQMQAGRGRPRSVDFCLRRQGGLGAWTNVVEAKWVNGKRDMSQEVFNDILRLEVVRRVEQKEQFDRLFLLAGPTNALSEGVFQRAANRGDGTSRISAFDQVLPRSVAESLTVNVATAPSGIIEFWQEAAKAINETNLPLTLKIELVAKAEAGAFSCLVWRVSSSQNRQTRPIAVTAIA